MAISPALANKMTTAGLAIGHPGWTIVQNANLLPPIPNTPALFGDQPAQALKKLMDAFYKYGRINWTWVSAAGALAGNGGLVKGLINAVACGSFNHNFKWLAENGLGIAGMGTNNEPSHFLTIPNKECIDVKWSGNVRTSTETFQSFKCFKFSQHYWVTHGGINYDVCYNNTFINTADIIWSKLLPETDPALNAITNGHGIFRLEKPLPDATHLIMIQQQGQNGWPNWQLATKEALLQL